MFLQAYWNTVLVCWEALKADIKREQDERMYPSCMEHFRWLNDEAMEFRRLYHSDSKIKVSSSDDCDVRIQRREQLQRNKRNENSRIAQVTDYLYIPYIQYIQCFIIIIIFTCYAYSLEAGSLCRGLQPSSVWVMAAKLHSRYWISLKMSCSVNQATNFRSHTLL
jgi:hypothetical protein